MKPAPLPGISQRPTWPTTPAAPQPSTPAPALTLRLQVLDTPDAKREAERITGQLDLFTEEDDHCDGCAMHGIDRPAAHTIGDLRLCRPCVDRAPSFAGYPTWTPAMRATRDHLMQEPTQ